MAHSSTTVSAGKARILDTARKVKREQQVPLLVHTTLRWARKINGRLNYFGKVDSALPDCGAGAAMAEYHRTVEDIRAGRTPRPKDEEVIRLGDACNAFLTAKEALRNSGEITARSFSDYFGTCSRMVDVLGRHRAVMDFGPADFRKLRSAFAKGRGPVGMGNHIRRARMVFKFAYDEDLIDRPVKYGQAFDMPSKKTLRQNRAARGSRMFESDELRKLIDKADQPLKAMLLLAANCAFGQADLARLPKTAIDLKNGWVDFPRPKTGIPRRCPLWPETIKAVQEAIAIRPEPKDQADDDLAFLTPTGRRIVRTQESKRQKAKGNEGRILNVDSVARSFKGLAATLRINGNRNFYGIRHGFQTIGEQAGDPAAVGFIMGHVDPSMAAEYRERFDNSRLKKVVDHVHAWLYGSEDKE